MDEQRVYIAFQSIVSITIILVILWLSWKDRK
jgi:hypothetical protein